MRVFHALRNLRCMPPPKKGRPLVGSFTISILENTKRYRRLLRGALKRELFDFHNSGVDDRSSCPFLQGDVLDFPGSRTAQSDGHLRRMPWGQKATFLQERQDPAACTGTGTRHRINILSVVPVQPLNRVVPAPHPAHFTIICAAHTRLPDQSAGP